jgi:hypothetical protein
MRFIVCRFRKYIYLLFNLTYTNRMGNLHNAGMGYLSLGLHYV